MTAPDDQIWRAYECIDRERLQLSQQKMNTTISVGPSILGARLGRKKLNVGNIDNIDRVGTTVRSAGRIGRENEM